MVEQLEAEIIDRCRQGDERAFTELVVKYQKPIYNLALRITQNRASAEEVTQATFVKVFEKLDSYKPAYPFFSWIYRIAMNLAINELKRKRRNYELDEASMIAENPPSFELSQVVQQALMLLRPDDRALIVLRHFQHLGYREIAYIINRSEGHVKSQLFKARHSLKQILTRMGIKNEE